jgi:hypothetical protein
MPCFFLAVSREGTGAPHEPSQLLKKHYWVVVGSLIARDVVRLEPVHCHLHGRLLVTLSLIEVHPSPLPTSSAPPNPPSTTTPPPNLDLSVRYDPAAHFRNRFRCAVPARRDDPPGAFQTRV